MKFNSGVDILLLWILIIYEVPCYVHGNPTDNDPEIIAYSVVGTILIEIILLLIAYFIWKKCKGRIRRAHFLKNSDNVHGHDNGGFLPNSDHNSNAEKGFGNYANKKEIPNTSKKINSPSHSTSSPNDKPWNSLPKVQFAGLYLARNGSFASLDNNINSQDPEIVSVNLQSQDFIGLGFNISGSMRDGIYVSEVHNRGPAIESGVLKVGDRIMNVTISFENMVFEDALTILSYASPYPVNICVQKHRSQQAFRSSGLEMLLNHPLYRSQSLDTLNKITKESLPKRSLSELKSDAISWDSLQMKQPIFIKEDHSSKAFSANGVSSESKPETTQSSTQLLEVVVHQPPLSAPLKEEDYMSTPTLEKKKDSNESLKLREPFKLHVLGDQAPMKENLESTPKPGSGSAKFPLFDSDDSISKLDEQMDIHFSNCDKEFEDLKQKADEGEDNFKLNLDLKRSGSASSNSEGEFENLEKEFELSSNFADIFDRLNLSFEDFKEAGVDNVGKTENDASTDTTDSFVTAKNSTDLLFENSLNDEKKGTKTLTNSFDSIISTRPAPKAPDFHFKEPEIEVLKPSVSVQQNSENINFLDIPDIIDHKNKMTEDSEEKPKSLDKLKPDLEFLAMSEKSSIEADFDNTTEITTLNIEDLAEIKPPVISNRDLRYGEILARKSKMALHADLERENEEPILSSVTNNAQETIPDNFQGRSPVTVGQPEDDMDSQLSPITDDTNSSSLNLDELSLSELTVSSLEPGSSLLKKPEITMPKTGVLTLNSGSDTDQMNSPDSIQSHSDSVLSIDATPSSFLKYEHSKTEKDFDIITSPNSIQSNTDSVLSIDATPSSFLNYEHGKNETDFDQIPSPNSIQSNSDSVLSIDATPSSFLKNEHSKNETAFDFTPKVDSNILDPLLNSDPTPSSLLEYEFNKEKTGTLPVSKITSDIADPPLISKTTNSSFFNSEFNENETSLDFTPKFSSDVIDNPLKADVTHSSFLKDEINTKDTDYSLTPKVTSDISNLLSDPDATPSSFLKNELDTKDTDYSPTPKVTSDVTSPLSDADATHSSLSRFEINRVGIGLDLIPKVDRSPKPDAAHSSFSKYDLNKKDTNEGFVQKDHSSSSSDAIHSSILEYKPKTDADMIFQMNTDAPDTSINADAAPSSLVKFELNNERADLDLTPKGDYLQSDDATHSSFSNIALDTENTNLIPKVDDLTSIDATHSSSLECQGSSKDEINLDLNPRVGFSSNADARYSSFLKYEKSKTEKKSDSVSKVDPSLTAGATDSSFLKNEVNSEETESGLITNVDPSLTADATDSSFLKQEVNSEETESGLITKVDPSLTADPSFLKHKVNNEERISDLIPNIDSFSSLDAIHSSSSLKYKSESYDPDHELISQMNSVAFKTSKMSHVTHSFFSTYNHDKDIKGPDLIPDTSPSSDAKQSSFLESEFSKEKTSSTLDSNLIPDIPSVLTDVSTFDTTHSPVWKYRLRTKETEPFVLNFETNDRKNEKDSSNYEVSSDDIQVSFTKIGETSKDEATTPLVSKPDLHPTEDHLAPLKTELSFSKFTKMEETSKDEKSPIVSKPDLQPTEDHLAPLKTELNFSKYDPRLLETASPADIISSKPSADVVTDTILSVDRNPLLTEPIKLHVKSRADVEIPSGDKSDIDMLTPDNKKRGVHQGSAHDLNSEIKEEVIQRCRSRRLTPYKYNLGGFNLKEIDLDMNDLVEADREKISKGFPDEGASGKEEAKEETMYPTIITHKRISFSQLEQKPGFIGSKRHLGFSKYSHNKTKSDLIPKVDPPLTIGATGSSYSKYGVNTEETKSNLISKVDPPLTIGATGSSYSKYGVNTEETKSDLIQKVDPSLTIGATGSSYSKYGVNTEETKSDLIPKVDPSLTIGGTNSSYSKYGVNTEETKSDLIQKVDPSLTIGATGSSYSKYGVNTEETKSDLIQKVDPSLTIGATGSSYSKYGVNTEEAKSDLIPKVDPSLTIGGTNSSYSKYGVNTEETKSDLIQKVDPSLTIGATGSSYSKYGVNTEEAKSDLIPKVDPSLTIGGTNSSYSKYRVNTEETKSDLIPKVDPSLTIGGTNSSYSKYRVNTEEAKSDLIPKVDPSLTIGGTNSSYSKYRVNTEETKSDLIPKVDPSLTIGGTNSSYSKYRVNTEETKSDLISKVDPSLTIGATGSSYSKYKLNNEETKPDEELAIRPSQEEKDKSTSEEGSSLASESGEEQRSDDRNEKKTLYKMALFKRIRTGSRTPSSGRNSSSDSDEEEGTSGKKNAPIQSLPEEYPDHQDENEATGSSSHSSGSSYDLEYEINTTSTETEKSQKDKDIETTLKPPLKLPNNSEEEEEEEEEEVKKARENQDKKDEAFFEMTEDELSTDTQSLSPKSAVTRAISCDGGFITSDESDLHKPRSTSQKQDTQQHPNTDDKIMGWSGKRLARAGSFTRLPDSDLVWTAGDHTKETKTNSDGDDSDSASDAVIRPEAIKPGENLTQHSLSCSSSSISSGETKPNGERGNDSDSASDAVTRPEAIKPGENLTQHSLSCSSSSISSGETKPNEERGNDSETFLESMDMNCKPRPFLDSNHQRGSHQEEHEVKGRQDSKEFSANYEGNSAFTVKLSTESDTEA